jgi:MFS family permease
MYHSSVRPSLPAPLRIPLYRSWWLAAQSSNAGTWMQQVAAAWLVLDQTGSAAAVGLLGLAQRGPSLILTPLAGRFADRQDRRRLLAWTFGLQLAAALGLTLAAVLDRAGPAVVIALSLVAGVGQALASPAQLATVSSLVPRELLPAAVSLQSAGFNLARVIGPALAGLLLVVHGAMLPFALNALSFLAPTIVALRLPVASSGGRGADATVRAAVGYARRSPALVRLLVGCAVFTFLAAPLTVLMPVYARTLGVGPDGLGLLLAAFGSGAALGAAVGLRYLRSVPRHRLIPAAMTVFAVADVLAAVAPTFVLALGACAVAGACWLTVFASTNASIQLITPDRLRGRVLSLYLWALVGPMALSGVALGWLAGAAGIRSGLLVCAAPLAAYGLFALRRPVPEIDGRPA